MKGAVLAFAVLVAAPIAAAAQTNRADTAGDLGAGYSIMRDSASLTFNGFRVSGAKNLSESLAAVIEVGVDKNGSGVYGVPSGGHNDTTILYTYTDMTVLGGVRLRRFDGSSTMPFFQVLGGYFSRGNSLSATAAVAPHASFALRVEGGFDLNLTSHFAVRLGGGWTFLNGGVRYMNQIGANAGVAYRLGKR